MNSLFANLIKLLETKAVSFKIIELSAPAMTVPDVIKFAKAPVKAEEVCKTIMLKTNDGFVGVSLQGDRRLDFKKAKIIFGNKVRFATAEEVKEHANIEPGAVCPLLLNVPLYIDKSVLELKNAHFGSGDHMFGIELDPTDLIELTRAETVDLSQ